MPDPIRRLPALSSSIVASTKAVALFIERIRDSWWRSRPAFLRPVRGELPPGWCTPGWAPAMCVSTASLTVGKMTGEVGWSHHGQRRQVIVPMIVVFPLGSWTNSATSRVIHFGISTRIRLGPRVRA